MAPVHGENLPLTHDSLKIRTLSLDPEESPDMEIWPEADTN